MPKETTPQYSVAVVGAGPAGLFAAKQLASEGAHVVLFNRDIKPGGLAEYGIYPDKHKMKEGLRAQFRQILTLPEVEYYGNVTIGEGDDFLLSDLLNLGFQAVLVTVGAQGTKWLGLPGEDLGGVYHAKDLVYHYNRLPPFSQETFTIGKRVAVVGVGNVMLDVTRYLINQRGVDEVIAVARRGPGEIKFTKPELEEVVGNLDMAAFEEEVARVTPAMQAVGQDAQKPLELVRSEHEKVPAANSLSSFRVTFLSAPHRILASPEGRVAGLEVEDTTLVLEGEEIRARGLHTYRVLDVDTVIFAIGDRVEDHFGLPVSGNEFVKHPEPRFPVEGHSHEAYDPENHCPLDGIFVAGWSRKASTGLVGIARKDGTNGARAVLQYLQTLQPLDEFTLDGLRRRIAELPHPVVTLDDLRRLEAIEKDYAEQHGLEEFKYASNEEMLEVMNLAPSPVHTQPS